jgi:outer membrane protein assembly factor BamB
MLHVLLLSIVGHYACNAQLNPDFSKYLMDSRNNAVSSATSVDANHPNMKRIYDTKQNSGELINSMALGLNSTLYFTEFKTVYGISTSGDALWKYKTKGQFRQSTPAVDVDGIVYVAGTDYDYGDTFDHGYVFAIDSGKLLWQYKVKESFYDASVNLAADGSIVVQSGGRYLYSLSKKGKLNWMYDLAPGYILQGSMEQMTMTPSIAADGTIITGNALGVLHALTTNGDLLWTYEVTPFFSFNAPVIDSEGDIYVTVDGGTGYDYNASVHCLSLSGELKWSLDLTTVSDLNQVIRDITAPVAHEGNVYFGVDEYLYSVSNGKLNWKWRNMDRAYGSLKMWNTPTISAKSNMIYFGGFFYVYGFKLTAEQPKTWTFRARMDTYSMHLSPTVGNDGVLYVADYHKVYRCSNE